LSIKTKVNYFVKESKDEKIITEKVSDMSLDAKIHTNKSLYSLLNGTSNDQKVNTSPEKIGEIALIDLPPKPALISCKPIFFDLGYNYLKYPTVASRVKEEKKGFFSRFNIFKK